jgi:hypothetical protein
MRRRDGLDLGEMVYRGRVLAVALARFSAIHLSKNLERVLIRRKHQANITFR